MSARSRDCSPFVSCDRKFGIRDPSPYTPKYNRRRSRCQFQSARGWVRTRSLGRSARVAWERSIVPATRLQRGVAIKILPEIFATDPDRLARFEREAQVLAALNHPNIAQIYTNARPLAGTDNASAPFWSPDGRSIGFFSDAALKRIDLVDGRVQTL